MDDREVGRLREVRKAALRTRAVAHAVAAGLDAAHGGRLVARAALSGWRVARLITGRLRGHPFAPFQRDAGPVVLAGVALRAALVRRRARTRDRLVPLLEAQVAELRCRVADARALTRDPDLSDAFGRSLAELCALHAALATLRGVRCGDTPPPTASEIRDGEWPFIAL